MPLRLLTPPEGDVVSLEEAKAHLRVEHDEDDPLIQALLDAATGHIDGPDGVLDRALLTQQWSWDIDAFPDQLVPLPMAPVSAVDAVKYLDAAGDEQTLDPASYVAHVGRWPAIELADGQTWPCTARQARCVRIEFTAGYGETDDVPERLKAAIKLMVGDLYANRETAAVGVSSAEIKTSLTVDRLLNNFIYRAA